MLLLLPTLAAAEAGADADPSNAEAPPAPPASTPAHGQLLFGLAWTPVGVGALAWDDADAFSGTLAGEFDGLLRPPLTAHGGWVGRHDAILGSLALVQFVDTWYAVTTAQSSVGGLRIGLDWRRHFWDREAGKADIYAQVGAFGIVPNAAEGDEGYTVAEQDAADETAAANRDRVAGVGAQGGLGAEYLFGDKQGRPAVALGARWLIRGYRGASLQEDELAVSFVLLSEAALVLEITR